MKLRGGQDHPSFFGSPRISSPCLLNQRLYCLPAMPAEINRGVSCHLSPHMRGGCKVWLVLPVVEQLNLNHNVQPERTCGDLRRIAGGGWRSPCFPACQVRTACSNRPVLWNAER
jgi:hypothetical protein